MELICEMIGREHFLLEKGSHPKDALLILLEGEFCCRISGKDYTVGRNTIFVFPKGNVFERKVLKPLKCIYIQFDHFPIALDDGPLTVSDPMRCESTIYYLAQALEYAPEQVKHYVWDLFLLCDGLETAKKVDDPIVNGCMEFLDSNLESEVHLDMLAESFCISKQGLIAKFKKYTGQTPMEYRNHKKIYLGKRLLTDTDLAIRDIADKCGFENVYYFSNCFKKHTGVSPTHYRSQFRL